LKSKGSVWSVQKSDIPSFARRARVVHVCFFELSQLGLITISLRLIVYFTFNNKKKRYQQKKESTCDIVEVTEEKFVGFHFEGDAWCAWSNWLIGEWTWCDRKEVMLIESVRFVHTFYDVMQLCIVIIHPDINTKSVCSINTIYDCAVYSEHRTR
jgi:hypothetical protein